MTKNTLEFNINFSTEVNYENATPEQAERIEGIMAELEAKVAKLNARAERRLTKVWKGES